mmetsp:Transcript_11557/g.32217  ORF Transcript_11557/g.32217 Transcript_11557/m.32217 type:complete len:339 (+) Transcript_11557:21-1037(+)
MLHEHIEIVEATIRMPVNDFQLNFTKSNPFGSLDLIWRHAVVVPSRLFCICPRSCDVQLLEVHIRATSSQSARIGLDAKQCVFGAHSTRDVDQNMLARLHQVEPVTMNILQVGITSGSSPARSRARSCKKPCLVLEALHPRRPGAMYEVLAERGVDIVGPVLRLQPDPYRRVGIAAVKGLATLVRKVHAVPDAGPIVVIALGVDSWPLHIAIATSVPIPEVVVPGCRSRRQKQIGPGLLSFGSGSRAITHVEAADETRAEKRLRAGVRRAQFVRVAIVQRLVAQREGRDRNCVERRHLDVLVVRVAAGSTAGLVQHRTAICPITGVVLESGGARLQLH